MSTRFRALPIAAGLLLGGCAAIEGHLFSEPLYARLGDDDARLALATMERTLETSADRRPGAWKNPKSGNGGRVTPVRTFVTDGGYVCRDYEETLTVGGKSDTRALTACRADDGRWRWP